MRQETIRILEELNVNLPTIRQQVRRLSGGQRQAIAIGRAVHWGSRILIMDEPMAALGLQEAGRVQELIDSLARRGLTQIIVSHNLEHVFSLSTRIAIMRLGRLVGGPTDGRARTTRRSSGWWRGSRVARRPRPGERTGRVGRSPSCSTRTAS